VIKNRFHSGGRQQPAEDLPPCRGADSRRHRIRSHYLKGTRGRQVVNAIGICCCEPGTGMAAIPKADQSARARIAATDLGNDRGARGGAGSGRIQGLLDDSQRRSTIERLWLWQCEPRAGCWARTDDNAAKPTIHSLDINERGAYAAPISPETTEHTTRGVGTQRDENPMSTRLSPITSYGAGSVGMGFR
jgi:hypothetical protein